MVVKGNQPTSGPRFEKELPSGTHPLQLYSLGTPNGQKVTILLEELGLAYDAWKVDIMQGENFGSGFLRVNPNEKIPALLDRSGPDGKEFTVFESGAILMYLAEKVPETSLYPREPAARSKVVQWLMWQVGTAPYLGQFGHFFKYAPEEVPYAKNRYTMEAKRILDVLDKQLGRAAYVTGGDYTVADIAIFPWIRCLDKFYGGGETLGLAGYANVARWLEEISARPAVVLGLQINGFSGDYMNHSSAGSSGK